MALTEAQQQTLVTYIRATFDPELVASRNDVEIARQCNEATSFVVTKNRLSRHDIITGTSDEGTVFAWAGGAYITRSQGERDAFREMFNSTGTVNPSMPNIQAAFNDIFSGTGGVTNRAHILAMSKRKATHAEKALATGTGTVSNPGALTFDGFLTINEVSEMLNRY